MDAAWAKPALRNLKAPSRASNERIKRHTHVLEHDFSVPMWRIIVAHNRQRPHHRDTRRIHGYKHHRVLQVARRPGCNLVHLATHEDADLAAWVHSARGPPLVAVEDEGVAVDVDGGLHVGGIAGGYTRLSHAKARANVASQQWLQPLLALLLRPVQRQHLCSKPLL